MSDTGIPSSVRIATGSIYFLVSTTLFVITIVVMTSIITSKKLRSTASYVIIMNILMAASIQLIVHAVGGIMAIADTNFFSWLDKILGACAQLGWCTVNVLTFSLALNRLAIFVNVPIIKEFKAIKPTIVLIIFSWTCGLYFFVVLMTPNAALRFFISDLIWDYDKLPLKPLLTLSERLIIVPSFALSLISYLIICCKIFYMQKSANSREIRLLIMAIVTFIDEALLFSIYQFGADVLPDSPYTWVGANFHWIMECGLHATALLCVNSVLRERIFDAVRKGKVPLFVASPNSTTSVTSVTPKKSVAARVMPWSTNSK